MYTITEVSSKEDLYSFAEMPFVIYRDNPYWVAPIIKDYVSYIQGKNNHLGDCPHKLFLAKKGKDVVGRVLVFIDTILNEYHGEKNGYIAEYECIDDLQVASLLLEAAENFCRQQGMEGIKGPVSLPAGDDHRGLMINGFDRRPAIMNRYNHDYYNRQFIHCGFEKYHDTYAYGATKKDLEEKAEKVDRILPRLQERFGFTIEKADIKHRLDRELRDAHKILNEGIPKEWKDFGPMTYEDVKGVFAQIKPVADPDLILFARTTDGRPIGFNLALPDYNEILREFHGRMGLFQILKFLRKRKSVKSMRVFVMFVIPEFQKKGVSSAIYHELYKIGVEKGYEYIEGSTIWDYNRPMMADIEKFGAKHTVTYRIYKKTL